MSVPMLTGLALAFAVQAAGEPARPNLVVLVVDDLGYGDLSCHGNEALLTPHIDALAERSARLESFYVSPVCAPTRAALLTGRYPFRSGLHSNGLGMAGSATTAAEVLAEAGYATGIFGKWHLGDHVPLRPQDQGFERSLVARGGVIGQLADQPNVVKYTDPVLMDDGVRTHFEGFATDVYFDQALAWIESVHAAGRPFFLVLATNAPHGPLLDVPEPEYGRLAAKLRDGLEPEGEAWQRADDLARVYALVERVDTNVGKLEQRLAELGVLEHTLLVFLSDNGASGERYGAGLRGLKGDVHEGGIRVPFFAAWPGRLAPGVHSRAPAAHVDLLPTLAAAAGIELDPALALDGRDVLPLLGMGDADDWPERVLAFEAHSGLRTGPWRNFCVRRGDYKLVSSGFRGEDDGRAEPSGLEGFELFDVAHDPGEARNLISERPELARELVEAYRPLAAAQLAVHARIRGPQPIPVGSPREDPVLLTRDNWRRLQSAAHEALWRVRCIREGRYEARLVTEPAPEPREIRIHVGELVTTDRLPGGRTEARFELELEAGTHDLGVFVDWVPVWQLELTLLSRKPPEQDD